MRSTRILTDDESVYTIPNSKIAESNIENISRRGLIRFAFTLGLVYDTSDENMAKAMKILHGIVDNFKGQDLPAYTPRIFFDTFGASAMNIRVIMWLKTGQLRDGGSVAHRNQPCDPETVQRSRLEHGLQYGHELRQIRPGRPAVSGGAVMPVSGASSLPAVHRIRQAFR